ncbi:iron uptake system protein EfeO [Pseudonocardia spinosispora]|uniref:iron uptake system protein EfeO n=1 Tax=Pseudonocardia spinosispora TaxID=103441 RepID=UPI0004290AEC|nr:iron uptake system protein EfeO [Pseudonocardia spinosispora]
MIMSRANTLVGAAALLCTASLLAGCGGSGGAGGQSGSQPATDVKITLSDAGCEPQPASVPAGPVKFSITNSGSAKVTEAEVQRDGRILGEKESLTPGLSGNFSLRLDGGQYSIYCPGGAKDTWTFTVTGGTAPSTKAADTSLADATKAYHDYVVAEVDKLTTSTKTFTDAVRAGDMAKAKAVFGPARMNYESIEPVAESFGDLDPNIDARIDDAPDPTQWTGFHRIEKAIWQDNTLAGMAPLADKLDADVATLKKNVADATYQPAQLANGASDLLTEVSTTKVTGEEDRYSHTDLFDFAANIGGARECFELLKPALAAKNPDLAQQLEARFTDVVTKLGQFKQGDGYVDYSTVNPDQRRVLANSVNALAEPLSKVSGQVV